jgi:hypothetical protein
MLNKPYKPKVFQLLSEDDVTEPMHSQKKACPIFDDSSESDDIKILAVDNSGIIDSQSIIN